MCNFFLTLKFSIGCYRNTCLLNFTVKKELPPPEVVEPVEKPKKKKGGKKGGGKKGKKSRSVSPTSEIDRLDGILPLVWQASSHLKNFWLVPEPETKEDQSTNVEEPGETPKSEPEEKGKSVEQAATTQTGRETPLTETEASTLPSAEVTDVEVSDIEETGKNLPSF